MVIAMRDTVIGKHLQIVKNEEAGVPNLNRIPKVLRALVEKPIEL